MTKQAPGDGLVLRLFAGAATIDWRFPVLASALCAAVPTHAVSPIESESASAWRAQGGIATPAVVGHRLPEAGGLRRAEPRAPASAAGERLSSQRVWLFPRAPDGPGREGFLRVINRSDFGGEVRIRGVDDAGWPSSETTLGIEAGSSVQLNSRDLERGNAGKGLAGSLGRGSGDWRLTLSSTLDFEATAYSRTADGLVAPLRAVAPMMDDGSRRVAFFNPGSNWRQVSLLRLVNAGDRAATARITGTDDAGRPGRGEAVAEVPAGQSRTFTARELESGDAPGLSGALGDGAGKWRLRVDADADVVAMSLLRSPTGHFANLSAAPPVPGADGTHVVPVFLGASDPRREGFLRVVNRTDAAGTVRVRAFGESGRERGSVTLDLEPRQARQFNSADLEQGNPAKGLSGSTGTGAGDWWLKVESELDVEVLSFVRAADGFVTPMHAEAPPGSETHRVAFFNPASNNRQSSSLRLVNPGPHDTFAQIWGFDDAGDRFDGVEDGHLALVDVPARGAVTVSSTEIEEALGDGHGKWRLNVHWLDRIHVVSLLESPTGHLLNLSASKMPNPIAFPNHGFPVTATLGDPPLTTQVATGGVDTGPITYFSHNPQIAAVDPTSGVVSIVSIGTAYIDATRPGDEDHYPATANYALWIEPERGELVDVRILSVSAGGSAVEYVASYASGLVVTVREVVRPIQSTNNRSCSLLGLQSGNVKVRWEERTYNGTWLSAGLTGCAATDQDRAAIPELSQSQVDMRLHGGTSFSPEYVEDHGAVVETEVESNDVETHTTKAYQSGFSELTVEQGFNEGGSGLDFNGDGDTWDYVSHTQVFWDGYHRSRHLRVSQTRNAPVDGEYEYELRQEAFRTPRRIVMPEGVPPFLRFNGDVGNIVVHIAEAKEEGQYYVKVNSGDPDVRLIVTRGAQTLWPDYFARAPVVDDADEAVYHVFAIKGPLEQPVLPEYPNFLVRSDHVDFLIPTLLRNVLDANRNVVYHAGLPAFLAHYDAARVLYDPARNSSSFDGNTILISPNHVYYKRPLIHEVCHSYHANVLPGGVGNARVQELYAMVPSNTSEPRYGDEQNDYWRLNPEEFFAEGLTTYIYLESGINFDDFDPISQVDSDFYYSVLKPYFDELFDR